MGKEIDGGIPGYQGADLKAKNKEGKTHMEMAATMNHKTVAELLQWYDKKK